MRQKLLWVAIATTTTLFTGLFSSSAEAQVSGNTNIKVQIPGVLRLYLSPEVTLNLSANDVLGASSGVVNGNNITITGLSGDVATNTIAAPTGTPDTAALSSTLSNFWTVQALGNGANSQIQVTSAVNTANICHTTNTSECISMSITAGGTNTFTPPGLGANNRVSGNLTLQLDADGAQSAGLYEGGVITVTAEQI
ncbi:MAG: hypothetical protein AAGF01_08945 [Cyanobacteria bacterium P01_G01_bin.38]